MFTFVVLLLLPVAIRTGSCASYLSAGLGAVLGNGEDFASATAVDKSGNVFVTGTSAGIGGVTIKYSWSVRAYLDIQVISNQAVLTWTNTGFSLQAGPFVSGMFTNVPGAASPYTNSFTAPQQYFKLRSL